MMHAPQNQPALVAAPTERRLKSALQALHPGTWLLCEQRPGEACHRAELPLAAADPLTFLRHLAAGGSLPAGGGSYWSDRSHALQSAGVGTAAEVGGDDGTPFADVCSRVERLIGCRRQRLYGGFRFRSRPSADRDESWWTPFGSYRFTLPRVELTRTATGTTLACNFRHGERDALAVVLRGLAGRCREAVRAALAGPAPAESRPTPVSPRLHVPDQARWRQLVAGVLRRFGSCLDGGRDPLEKIVLARRTTLRFAARVCALALLQRLRTVNPTAFHFALQPRSGVTFFGASPERLLRISGETLETEALAGTRPRGDSPAADARLEAELLRSDKELREHRYVHASIARSLRELCTRVDTQDTVRVRKLAHVQHLHTSFSGTLRPGVGLAQALQRLHPTPAVGGYPTCGVSDLIAATEGFDRGWYAGPVGWIGAGAAEFAVGIRAGVADGDTLHLYAGNGIVRGSTADAEWAEMEQKILQILDVV
jgi:menaquinone-specific isochorismate synthase